MDSRPVLIAGAGIAGLAAALAFSRRGIPSRILEKSPAFDEAGAGLQLSPNATRILDRLGVLDRLRAVATKPEAIALRSAAKLATILELPVGEAAERRWGAPYLTTRRSDLQASLLAAAIEDPLIAIETGAALRDVALEGDGVSATVDRNGGPATERAALLVGADGVWSDARRAIDGGENRFSGMIAWRATIAGHDAAAAVFLQPDGRPRVSVFLHPGCHIVAYPLRDGAEINLVAITSGSAIAKGWASSSDIAPLTAATARTAEPLRGLAEALRWKAFPVHIVAPGSPWTLDGRFVLIGDAAHAMTPFAAQGAAMAIEDAETLALCLGVENDQAAALARYEAMRRPRIARVARRGALNGFAWHAWGPFAVGRDLVLKAGGIERLTAGLDWLYDYDPIHED